jgi:hypothetical protein
MLSNLAVAKVVALAVAVALFCSCSIGFCIPMTHVTTGNGNTVLLSPPLLVLEAGKRQILKLFLFYIFCAFVNSF